MARPMDCGCVKVLEDTEIVLDVEPANVMRPSSSERLDFAHVGEIWLVHDLKSPPPRRASAMDLRPRTRAGSARTDGSVLVRRAGMARRNLSKGAAAPPRRDV